MCSRLVEDHGRQPVAKLEKLATADLIRRTPECGTAERPENTPNDGVRNAAQYLPRPRRQLVQHFAALPRYSGGSRGVGGAVGSLGLRSGAAHHAVC